MSQKRQWGFVLGEFILLSPLFAFVLLADESTFEFDTLKWFIYAGGVQVGLMISLGVWYYIELRAARATEKSRSASAW